MVSSGVHILPNLLFVGTVIANTWDKAAAFTQKVSVERSLYSVYSRSLLGVSKISSRQPSKGRRQQRVPGSDSVDHNKNSFGTDDDIFWYSDRNWSSDSKDDRYNRSFQKSNKPRGLTSDAGLAGARGNSRARIAANNHRRGQGEDASYMDRSVESTLSPKFMEAEITDINAHFFSKKSLHDPAFVYNNNIDDGDNQVNHQLLYQNLCDAAGITRPSRIQALAWPKVLTGKHCIIGEQTGSGKSLAYLLPLLQKVLSSKPNSDPGQPKILVLAPTAELADQIRAVCTKISQRVPFNTMVVTATGKFTTTIRDQIRMIQRQPIDILVSTPGRISTILRTRNSGLDLSKLQAIVLDEVDILMVDETFGPQLRTVGAAAPLLDKTPFIFVTATLPDSIVETIEKEFPGVEKVIGPGLHRVAPSLNENLVDVSVPAEQNRNEELCFDIKAKQLLKALRQHRCRRTLVFCNTVESCRDVENLLNRKDRKGRLFEVLAYHNAMTPEARNTNLQVFSNGRQGLDGDNVDYVLICTDRAARGVDFDASSVDHVVIFDFPKDPAEYIRRVGRTARAGRSGTSTVFAYGWQLPIARSVMGKKLENFTVASNDMKEKSEKEYEFRHDRRTKKRKDALIKERIESGRLWDE
jgi:ATP-dependent RNA helicase DDX18/HAS1